jgi:hypothetical protein
MNHPCKIVIFGFFRDLEIEKDSRTIFKVGIKPVNDQKEKFDVFYKKAKKLAVSKTSRELRTGEAFTC